MGDVSNQFPEELQGFENFIKFLKDIGKKPSVSVMDKNMVENFLSAYKLVYDSVRHKKGICEISYKIHEPFSNMGVISIIGDKIVVKDPHSFNKVISMATNYEIYAKVDGTIQANFTFYGLTR